MTPPRGLPSRWAKPVTVVDPQASVAASKHGVTGHGDVAPFGVGAVGGHQCNSKLRSGCAGLHVIACLAEHYGERSCRRHRRTARFARGARSAGTRETRVRFGQFGSGSHDNFAGDVDPADGRSGKVDHLVGGEVDGGGARPVTTAHGLKLAQEVVAGRDAAKLADLLTLAADRGPGNAAGLHLRLAENLLRQRGHDDAAIRGLLGDAEVHLNMNGGYCVHRQVDLVAIAGVERDGVRPMRSRWRSHRRSSHRRRQAASAAAGRRAEGCRWGRFCELDGKRTRAPRKRQRSTCRP